MADAGDSKSPALYGCVGSTPTSGTSAFPGPLRTRFLLQLRRDPGFVRLRRRWDAFRFPRHPGFLRDRLQEALRDLSLPARRRPDVFRRRFVTLAEGPLERRYRRRKLRDPEPGKGFRPLPDAPDLLGYFLRGLHGTERRTVSVPIAGRLRLLLLARGIVVKEVGELLLAVGVAARERRQPPRQPGMPGGVGRFRRGYGNGRRLFARRRNRGRIGDRRGGLVGQQERRRGEDGVRVGGSLRALRGLRRRWRVGPGLGAREGSLQRFPDAGRLLEAVSNEAKKPSKANKPSKASKPSPAKNR
jgi:hypothetical protein